MMRTQPPAARTLRGRCHHHRLRLLVARDSHLVALCISTLDSQDLHRSARQTREHGREAAWLGAALGAGRRRAGGLPGGCRHAAGRAQHRTAKAQAAPTDQGDCGVLGHATVARGGHLFALRVVHHHHAMLCLQLPGATDAEGDRGSVSTAKGGQDVHRQAGDCASP